MRKKQFIDNLLLQMTIEEKLGQLLMARDRSSEITGPLMHLSNSAQAIRKGEVGSFVSIKDADLMRRLQDIAINESRLKIPLFFSYDIIHGLHTIFPLNLSMSNSFNMELIEKSFNKIAYEAVHHGYHQTLAPMIDLVRDPRWGRVMESNGEDPFLSRKITKAVLKGLHQKSLKNKYSLASCCKHFIGYGACEQGREYNTVDMSKLTLYNYYLPPFIEAVKYNTSMIMASFNTIDGIPSCGNKEILNDLLRKKIGFNSPTISDMGACKQMFDYKLVKSEEELTKKIYDATLDIELGTRYYHHHAKKLLSEDKMSIDEINKMTRRVLEFKYDLGLFDNPHKNTYKNHSDYVCNDHVLKTALEMSNESIVLLKNDNQVLPIINKKRKILIVGSYANEKHLFGRWYGLGDFNRNQTIFDNLLMHKCNVEYVSDANLLTKDYVEKFDYVISYVGDYHEDCGEGSSKTMLRISDEDNKLIDIINECNVKKIMVVLTGRPLVLTDLVDKIDSILLAYHLGTQTAEALYQTIFGINNPSGKLSMSMPYIEGQIPIYYNRLQPGSNLGENPSRYSSRFLDCPNEPLYKFGHGLSYSNFEYDNYKITLIDENVEVEFDVYNNSDYDGKEVVLVFIECMYDYTSRPINELKGFEKRMIKKQTTEHFKIIIPKDEFDFYNNDFKKVHLETNYKIRIGSSLNNYKEFDIEF